jgi:hypothetical protein
MITMTRPQTDTLEWHSRRSSIVDFELVDGVKPEVPADIGEYDEGRYDDCIFSSSVEEFLWDALEKQIKHLPEGLMAAHVREGGSFDLRFETHQKRFSINSLRSNREARLQELARAEILELARGGEATGLPASVDENTVVVVSFSDSDKSPYGPGDNDHNGALNVAFVSRDWVWLVTGKTGSC